MLDKKLFIICMLFFVFPFVSISETEARTPSVNDCLEAEADCEDTTPLTENEGEAEPVAELNDSGSLVFDLIKMFFALLLVLALIYIMLKLLNKRNKMFNQIRHLENLGGISVGQNKSIQIIRIGSKFYVIGVGDNVEMLQEITDEKVITQLLEKGEEEPFHINSLLPSFLQKNTKEKTSSPDSRNFKNLFADELENLKKNRADLINRREDKR